MGLVLPEDISDRDYVRYGTEAEGHLRALFAMDFRSTRSCMRRTTCSLTRSTPGCMPHWTGELVDPEGRHGIPGDQDHGDPPGSADRQVEREDPGPVLLPDPPLPGCDGI